MRIPAPVAGLAIAEPGVVLQLLDMLLNQFDGIQQRRMQRVDGFVRQFREIIQAAQPVTLLSQATVAAAIPGWIKDTVVRAILEADFL